MAGIRILNFPVPVGARKYWDLTRLPAQTEHGEQPVGRSGGGRLLDWVHWDG
jgi:hypothetical protein